MRRARPAASNLHHTRVNRQFQACLCTFSSGFIHATKHVEPETIVPQADICYGNVPKASFKRSRSVSVGTIAGMICAADSYHTQPKLFPSHNRSCVLYTFTYISKVLTASFTYLYTPTHRYTSKDCTKRAH
jgi:hypothetical protein